MNVSKIDELAYKIAELLETRGCHTDTAIYFGGKRLSTFRDGKWKLEDGFVAGDMVEYANDKTITMTFEGDFYDVINYGLYPNLQEEFISLIESYGYYYELGNAWNLALYDI